MTIRSAEDAEKQFPFQEEFLDYSGRARQFEISLHKVHGHVFGIEARELSELQGYRFEIDLDVCSISAIGSALAKLRRKIRNAVVTRNLQRDKRGNKVFARDEIRGRISCSGIVVDGELLGFKELEDLLTTYEGFEILV